MNRKQLARLLAAFYLVAVLLGVGLCGTRLWGRKACTTQPLAVDEAQWSSIMDHHPVAWAGYDAESLVSTDNDPYLVWQIDGSVCGLEMQIRSSQPIRDPQVYYTTQDGEDWSSGRTLPLVEADPTQGIYRFALPQGKKVHSLRLDPTSSAGAFFELDHITLNPAGSGFLLTAGEVFLLLIAPFFAVLVVQEVLVWRGREKRRLLDLR